MSAFEFFFSFYGLVLGLSVAVIATGLATAIQHRHTVRIGWLTPMLAIFVALDIATFWTHAWTSFQDLEVSYGLMVVGLSIALVYFIAASLIFPHNLADGDSLDDHFWANRRVVLVLLIFANLMAVIATVAVELSRGPISGVLINYGSVLVVYLLAVGGAALAKRPRLFGWLIGIHIGLYILIAAASLAIPESQFASPPSAAQ